MIGGHMADESYRGGRKLANGCGCVTVAVIAVPVILVVTLADALGDCFDKCQRRGHAGTIVLTLIIAGVIGLAVRMLVNHLRRSDS